MLHYRTRKGMVFILCLIFLAVFCSLAIAMCTMSNRSLKIASNHHKANVAFANADSGMQVMRFWLARLQMPGVSQPSDYFTNVISSLQNDLAANNISNIILNNSGAISPVTLNTTPLQTFNANIQTHPIDPEALLVLVTGNCGPITRTLLVNFKIETNADPIFDFGLATKGPVQFPGNPTIEGVNHLSEADIYIESANSSVALQVDGNANFDGNINIGNENANALFDGDVLIGGEQGQTAIDNHVFAGTSAVDFPIPDTDHFRQYITGSTIKSSTDTSEDMILSNAVIRAGTNPTFTGNVAINGVLFIESPNEVTFDGNVEMKGLIVADGDVDNPGTNQMTFNGNFQSGTFPDSSEFDPIRAETGSSLVAPGFAVNMAGNFASLSGVMAVSGFNLSGNANALIKGSIINYSESPTVVLGNATLRFDRSDNTEIPAGFAGIITLAYQPASWSMIH